MYYVGIDGGTRIHSGRGSDKAAEGDYRIPESFRAFCNIVSLTAANTSRIFDVSVACVKLEGLVLRDS